MWNGWINFAMTALSFAAFVVAFIYYFNPKRKKSVEEPKFRMLDDDDEAKPKKDGHQDQKDEKK